MYRGYRMSEKLYRDLALRCLGMKLQAGDSAHGCLMTL